MGKVAIFPYIENFLACEGPGKRLSALHFLWWAVNDAEETRLKHRKMFHLVGTVSSSFFSNYALRETAAIHVVPNKHVVMDSVTSSFILPTNSPLLARRTRPNNMFWGWRKSQTRVDFNKQNGCYETSDVTSVNERTQVTRRLSVLPTPIERTLRMQRVSFQSKQPPTSQLHVEEPSCLQLVRSSWVRPLSGSFQKRFCYKDCAGRNLAWVVPLRNISDTYQEMGTIKIPQCLFSTDLK